MRRDALDALSAARQIRHHYQIRTLEEPIDQFPKLLMLRHPELRGRFHSLSQLTQDMVDALDMVTLPLADVFNSFHNSLLKDCDLSKFAVEIPRVIFHNAPQIAKMLEKVREYGITKAVCNNIGAVYMAKKAGLTPIGGWALKIANTIALQQYRELGVQETDVSFELSVNRIRTLGDAMPYGAVTYGHLPLMTFRNCPGKNEKGCGTRPCTITDRKGNAFTLDCYGRRYSHLLNPIPLRLAADTDYLADAHFHLLRFTVETAEQCADILRRWKTREFSDAQRTTGLYYRKLL
jgi:putative protease